MLKVSYENPAGAPPVAGLYSHVGRADGGTLVFIAGQLSVGPGGEVVGKGNFGAQFDQTFKNLGDVLAGLGAGYRNVVKFTTYLVNREDLPAFMERRRARFPELFGSNEFPPNTLLIVDGLVKEEFLIEVEAVAALDR